ncbi:MAG TPA: hypothetical protein VGW34_14455 [Allosphingosinicella sp.]|nr:hypothetical protein [Allosphingosinicella sp.]
MRSEHDAMMVVRADLCERLESLQLLSRRRSQADFAASISTIRQIAAAYGLAPVVRLAEAVQRAIADTDRTCPVALYLDRLHDAIGCERDDEQASRAMIASVSVRLTA